MKGNQTAGINGAVIHLALCPPLCAVKANGKKILLRTHQLQPADLLRTIDNYSKAALFFACSTVQSTPRSSLMNSLSSFRLQFIAVGLCMFFFRDAAAQNQPTYMQLSPTVKAVLYSPSSNSAARV